jgi:hypothetical protein
MSLQDYDEDILDYLINRNLIDPPPEKQTCALCENHSIYVEEHDISYRFHNKVTTMELMCYPCFIYEIVLSMDAQLADYYSSIL